MSKLRPDESRAMQIIDKATDNLATTASVYLAHQAWSAALLLRDRLVEAREQCPACGGKVDNCFGGPGHVRQKQTGETNQREAIEKRVEHAIEYCRVMQPSERLHQVRKILDPDFF